jgi:lysozyme family protein
MIQVAGADGSVTPDTDVAQLEAEARRAEAQARLLEARRAEAQAGSDPPKDSWWKNTQISVLLLGGIVTLLGNLGVAAYNGFTSRDQEAIKARNALDLEREKAKASLVLQAISSNNPQIAQRNILFFIDAGFIPDPDGKLKTAASKYAPVLPSLGSAPQNAIAPADYGRAFWTAVLDQEKVQSVDASVDKIAAGRARLEAVADKVDSPWYVVGIVWLLETGGSFAAHLHNGDPLTARTVHVPAGRPITGQPPFSWEESAADAIRLHRLDHLNSVDLASVLQAIERVNGLGYRNRGVSSPYLWAYTSAYTGGKFVAEGMFDPNAKAAQPGAVALLRRLQERGIVKLDTVAPDNLTANPRQ